MVYVTYRCAVLIFLHEHIHGFVQCTNSLRLMDFDDWMRTRWIMG